VNYLTDVRLSLRAKGLMAMYVSLGEVPASNEVVKIVSEGRDAIRKAMSELTRFGYIEKVHYQTGYGHWQTLYRFTGAWKTGAGFSGRLNSCPVDSYSDSLLAIDIIPNGIISIAASGEKEYSEEGEVNKYDFLTGDYEEDDSLEQILANVAEARKAVADKRRAKRQPKDDLPVLGELPEDKKAKRQEKYTREKFSVAKPTDDRNERPESEWTTNDIVAEFAYMCNTHAPGIGYQLNAKTLAQYINKQYGDHGVPRESMLRAIRAFFNDPRMIRTPGVGQPLYRRFLAYWPTVQGIYSTPPVVEDDYKTSEHSEKMLKLLEG
jgi:hypothetical protein